MSVAPAVDKLCLVISQESLDHSGLDLVQHSAQGILVHHVGDLPGKSWIILDEILAGTENRGYGVVIGRLSCGQINTLIEVW